MKTAHFDANTPFQPDDPEIRRGDPIYIICRVEPPARWIRPEAERYNAKWPSETEAAFYALKAQRKLASYEVAGIGGQN